MKSVHLVIPDLFLPKHIAVEVCAELRLSSLEQLLSRGALTSTAETGDFGASLENMLCGMFGLTRSADAPVAPISAAFDGLAAGCWLRADPVHLRLQRDQLLLSGVLVDSEEATQFCASLNTHFAGQGLEFFAPHPQRWYVRLDVLPHMRTTPYSEVFGRNVRSALPTGADAAHWHQLSNEIQMLLFAHPVNQEREARGEVPVNSMWFWGAGDTMGALQIAYDSASSDESLVEMLAAAASVPFAAWNARWDEGSCDGRQLLVWTGLRAALQRGDLAAWRDALQDFEVSYAQPLSQALRSGKIEQLQLDILGENGTRCVLFKRAHTWAFWRKVRRLAEYSLV
ncbi:MAG: hypothetical protein WAW75_02080 [Gallionella sp.]